MDAILGALTGENLLALLTLTAMEIVLGIDNIVFIAILTSKVEPAKQDRVRTLGLGLAMFFRIALLLGITWVMGLTAVLFSLFGQEFNGKDLILLAGGLFLITKATLEIHHKIEDAPKGHDEPGATAGAARKAGARAASGAVIAQILMIDLVFSLDSVITAVGMARALWVMIVAVVIAVGVMLIFSGRIVGSIEATRHEIRQVVREPSEGGKLLFLGPEGVRRERHGTHGVEETSRKIPLLGDPHAQLVHAEPEDPRGGLLLVPPVRPGELDDLVVEFR